MWRIKITTVIIVSTCLVAWVAIGCSCAKQSEDPVVGTSTPSASTTKPVRDGAHDSPWRAIDEAVSAGVNEGFDKRVHELGGRVVDTKITYPSQAASRPVATTQPSPINIPSATERGKRGHP